jgi:predicted Fe-Mo cluster-binding NifX family protein
MKIAVTYDNGNVHQHFGMATCVKFYNIQNGQIVSTDIVEMKSPGHGMIAPVLFGNGAEVLICGHIKPTAANALLVSGLMLCAGAKGDADRAVEDYISGVLKNDETAIDMDEVCGHED